MLCGVPWSPLRNGLAMTVGPAGSASYLLSTAWSVSGSSALPLSARLLKPNDPRQQVDGKLPVGKVPHTNGRGGPLRTGPFNVPEPTVPDPGPVFAVGEGHLQWHQSSRVVAVDVIRVPAGEMQIGIKIRDTVVHVQCGRLAREERFHRFAQLLFNGVNEIVGAVGQLTGRVVRGQRLSCAWV